MDQPGGMVVAGYPLGKVEGQGAYSLVYQAQTSAEPIAIKLLREDLRKSAALNVAVASGWGKAQAVNHPNVVAVLGAGVDAEHGAYALLELISAKTLRQYVEQGPKMAWRDVLEVAGQMASGLQALHSAGIILGHMRPSNVLVTRDQDVKLGGAGGLTEPPCPLTEVLDGPAIGYVAPERLNRSPATPGTDLYSLECACTSC